MSLIGDRLFVRIARLGVQRPRAVLTVSGVVLLLFALLIPGLGVSTSRTGLVSADDPQQARMNAFFERFGRPDAPVFVVSGGDPQARRAVVDALEAGLAAEEQFAGKVLARIRPQDVAGVLLLARPDALAQLIAELPPGVPLGPIVAQGIPGWFALLDQQLQAGLEQGETPVEKIGEQLDRLAALAKTFDDAIAGKGLSLGEYAQRSGVDDAGYLVTADGSHHLVTMLAEMQTDEGRDLMPLIGKMRAIRDQVLADAPPGITADLTGLPALSVDELGILAIGMRRSSIATTAGIFLLCLALFRSLRQTIVSLLPLLPGVVVTLAFVRLVFHDLNLVTSGFVAVLLGLGIDFAVHLVARRNEQVRRGDDASTAVVEAVRTSGPGVFTGAVVTAIAFLTTTTTDFTAFAELGIITAVGLMVIAAATFLLIPPLLVIGRKQGTASAAPELQGLVRVVGMIRAAKIAILVLALAGSVGGAVALNRIAFDSRYFSFLPESTESARGLLALEYDPLASPVFAAMQAESVEDARVLAAKLRELDSVAGVQSPSDMLPPLDERGLATVRTFLQAFGDGPDFDALAAQPVPVEPLLASVRSIADALGEVAFALRQVDGPVDAADRARKAFEALGARLAKLDSAERERLGAMHENLASLGKAAWTTAEAVVQRGGYANTDVPPKFAPRFVSRDGARVAVYAVPSGAFWETAIAERFVADVRAIDENAAGLAMIHVAHGQMVLAGFKRASILAGVLIFVLLVADFRRVSDALLALLPTALGWLWMLGALVLLGLRFDIANIVALPLVLGIGIAFGVHMVHRVREEEIASGRPVNLDEVVRGTGGAIIVAALTTILGFAGLMLGKYGAMLSLGSVMCIGIAATLLATVFVLPAVLVVLGRAR